MPERYKSMLYSYHDELTMARSPGPFSFVISGEHSQKGCSNDKYAKTLTSLVVEVKEIGIASPGTICSFPILIA